MHPETLVPLTELVHYFNKRSRLSRGGAGEDSFELADGRVQVRWGACVLGTVFQPVVASACGQVIGHEAHLRLLEGGEAGLPPSAIFLAARDDDELVHLDRLARTMHALNFLQEREQHGGFLSLNVHPQLLRTVREHHGQVFESILTRCGLTPERIVLEVSDDGFENLPRLIRALAGYRERGYRIAIDNFGRHTADLERLEALAPDIVKLDRSLIGHAGHLSLAKRVLTELNGEIRGLGALVACQCIENPLQLQVARDAGVDWLQGYLIGRPAPACLPLPRPRHSREAA
jgi:EAL domain-containing protein (putative c-di-GMP-specific phosphodiesterase class I)